MEKIQNLEKITLQSNEKIYTLADLSEATKLVKNGEYVFTTIGCAYKLIMDTQGIATPFIEFIQNITQYIEKATWEERVRSGNRVTITDPETGKNFFIFTAKNKEEFDIVKKISIEYVSLVYKCVESLEDYITPGISCIIVRGMERFFDLNLDTDKLKIYSNIWAGIDFRS